MILYERTGGADWTENANWGTEFGIKYWFGVAVDEEGRVIKLELVGNGLVGALPSELQHLSALEYLDLSGNALEGQIPAELGKLGALTLLWLFDNHLTGPIPHELGKIGTLRSVFMYQNRMLTGRGAFKKIIDETTDESCNVELT